MRRTISVILAIVLIGVASLVAKYLIDNKQKPKSKADKIVKTVFAETVNNKSIPLIITTNGNLVAKNKIEIYAEVQGVLESTNKEFKSGTAFKKGETLVKINSEEFYANLQAQKSNLFNAITAIMPDIKLDYPKEYDKWQRYLQNFDINKTISNLPELKSEKEKFFISGRGINTAYFNVNNLEVKWHKYNLKAPFDGILTDALVNPGTLIRPSQKLGEFIDPSVFELSAPVKSEFQYILQVGKAVSLLNSDKSKTYTGKVVRINGKVDATTQSIQAFIQVDGDDLKEGQYLDVNIQAKSEDNAFEIERNLLVDNSKIYIIKKNILKLVDVHTVFENKNTLIVKGLPNGTTILAKPVPGAYSGMLVKIFNENTKH